MADNYLEKRMEDYRSGRLAQNKSLKSSSAGIKPPLLAGRRALVTGGASGIGKEIVARFREEGCRVAIFDIDIKKGNETAQKTGARFYPCDLADLASLRANMTRLLEDWGDLDIIVNNAAECRFVELTETSTEEFIHTLGVNLVAPFEISRLFAIHRRNKYPDQSRYGRIINISSTRAIQSEPSTQPYSASKGGLMSLTHSLMASFAGTGVTVNAILPGWIETGDYAGISDTDHRFHPSGRVGKPADIARACLFLADPAADFINGESLTIDGGVTRKMIYP